MTELERELEARVAELTAEVERLTAEVERLSAEPATTHLGLGDGERRTVTVLFADVSGFTALGERLDPETFRAVVRDTMATVAACVVTEGGVVEKFIGDAACAVFGAPVSHPDEPQRAARAALAIHAAVAERAASHPDRPPIGVHIGVNTGLVIAGGMGDGSQFGVLGDTVNTASRLLNLAKEGETFVSAETARRLRRGFRLEDRGVHEVKGKATPVAAFALLGPLSAAEDDITAVGSDPVLGRDADLATVREIASGVRPGLGRAVALIGPSGTGTSRLADAVGDALLAEGWRVTTPRDEALGFGDERTVVVVDVDEEAGHAQRLADLLVSTTTAPVLWVLSGSALPMPFVGLPNLAVHRVGPLADEVVADLFDRLLPGALDSEQRRGLAALAEGNPSFAQEIAHSLVDDGLVVETGDGWRAVGDIASCALPDSLAELVEARIDALPTAARTALQDAAVLGRRFRLDVLQQVSTAPAGLDAALADLVEAGLLVPPADAAAGFWTLPSRLVRDVAYGSLLTDARRARHRAVYEVLVHDPATDPDILGWHAARGDDRA